MRKTTTQRVKVFTASGVSRYGMLTYKLDSVFERMYVNRLVVKDEQGTTVAQGAVENYFVTDDADSGEASNSKTVKIPVPGLKPGYTFECTVTLEYLVPTKELPFQEIALACNSPVRVSGFFIEGDVGQLKWKASNGIELQHRKNVLFAVETNTAPLSYESHQPSVEKFSPVVWLGPAKTTWETAASAIWIRSTTG